MAYEPASQRAEPSTTAVESLLHKRRETVRFVRQAVNESRHADVRANTVLGQCTSRRWRHSPGDYAAVLPRCRPFRLGRLRNPATPLPVRVPSPSPPRCSISMMRPNRSRRCIDRREVSPCWFSNSRMSWPAVSLFVSCLFVRAVWDHVEHKIRTRVYH